MTRVLILLFQVNEDQGESGPERQARQSDSVLGVPGVLAVGDGGGGEEAVPGGQQDRELPGQDHRGRVQGPQPHLLLHCRRGRSQGMASAGISTYSGSRLYGTPRDRLFLSTISFVPFNQ